MNVTRSTGSISLQILHDATIVSIRARQRELTQRPRSTLTGARPPDAARPPDSSPPPDVQSCRLSHGASCGHRSTAKRALCTLGPPSMPGVERARRSSLWLRGLHYARRSRAMKPPSPPAARPPGFTASCRAGIATRTLVLICCRISPDANAKAEAYYFSKNAIGEATTLPPSAAASVNGHHLRLSDDFLSQTWMCRCLDRLNQGQLRLTNLNGAQIVLYFIAMALHLLGDMPYVVEIIILPYSRALLRLSHKPN
jgi:hypothetical protein